MRNPMMGRNQFGIRLNGSPPAAKRVFSTKPLTEEAGLPLLRG